MGLEQKRLGAWRPEASDLCSVNSRKDSASHPLPQLAPRLVRVTMITGLGLSLLRSAGEPGHLAASALSVGLARLWRLLLGPAERRFLAFTALEAAEPEDRITAAEVTLGVPRWEGVE